MSQRWLKERMRKGMNYDVGQDLIPASKLRRLKGRQVRINKLNE